MTTRIALAAAAVALLGATTGLADENGSTRDAGRHFQRAVALYGEADYRAALVEFKRAYAIAPNTAVLYNVGETQYQLQDYAGALTTFERYLAESAPGDTHHAEVENNVEILRARVGHVSVVTFPPGADVAVDDQAAGHTPIDKPILVSIGHRKITASMQGRQAVTRYVDVATDDNLTVTLQMTDAGGATTAMPRHDADATSAAHSTPGDGSHTLQTVGWIATGGLAIGAIATGIVAAHESSVLQSDRNSYPTSSATLERDAHSTTTYSIIADSLAAGAVLVGGITLVSVLGGGSSSAPKRGSTGGEVQVVLGPTSAGIAGSF
jgi:hypothetical protein